MTTELSKKDYLKKYLSSGSDKKKKKKKVLKNASGRSRIVDDDIDLKNMKPLDDSELEIFDLAEEAPQIAGIVDDRPEEVRAMAEFRGTKKWKVVADEYGIDDVKVSAIGDDDDLSPPRKPKRRDSGSPPAGRGQDSDASPPRRSRKSAASDASPPRRKRADPDPSPPRRVAKQRDSEAPPARKSRKEVDSDESPPRKSRKQEDSDASPPRRRDSDASPPRKPRKHASSGEFNRRSKHGHKSMRGSDSSPVRQAKGRAEDSDESPPRKKQHRSEARRGESPEPRRSVKVREERRGRTETTLEGKKAGLQGAEALRKETAEFRQKQKDTFAAMTDECSGRNAVAVVRDRRTGRKRDLKEEARQRREKEEKEAEKLAKYAVWGKGVKQVEEMGKKMKEDLYEMSKPLARYADDKDLEDMLKNEEREGDPMLDYIRQKRRKEGGDGGGSGGGGAAKQTYQGSYMPNRYGIPPGHRWDGVDRSCGYEKRWFEEQNARKAREEEAFKWSTSDM